MKMHGAFGFVTILSLLLMPATSKAQEAGSLQKQWVVVRRDITQESGCMYEDSGQKPTPCPPNTVKQTSIIREDEAIANGEVFVRIASETVEGMEKAFKQINEKFSPTSTTSQQIKSGNVLLKSAFQACNNNDSSIFFFTTFPSPSTTVKFTTSFYRTYLNGGCNGRRVNTMNANLYSGPNVYLNRVSWASSQGVGGYWTGNAGGVGCQLLPYTASFPNVIWDKGSGYVSAEIYRNNCSSFNPNYRQTYWQLP